MMMVGIVALMAGWAIAASDGTTTTLQEQLSREGAKVLAKVAISEGDPRRGAIVFYQPQHLCATCHIAGKSDPGLGPDLTALGKTVTGAELVEALLEPSKTIRKGYETVTIVTTAGKTLTGRLLEDRPDVVVLRESTPPGKSVSIARAEIDERRDKGPSLMPEGLVNLLGSRQDFLDLVRYLIEIAELGPARALELRPDPALIGLGPLPEYESDLDHAGIISALDAASFQRGHQIYDRVCANCHGTKDRVGSLPSSLRFASGAFKNGSDPYRMYQTLTRGFGQMPPQTWMVPLQKYDVIHYVREQYLKGNNPNQYARVDRDYLGRLPKGKTRGPAPNAIEPWVAMDYGQSLMATVEAGDDGSNIAYKGIAVRLDPGPGGVSRGRAWSLFEHDTLRLAALWTGEGFIDWEGINFNGKHQVHPRVVGLVRIANPSGPGWADPETGSFDDPRPKGRDGRPYGPLPRSWAHYRGLYQNGNRVIVSYTVGTSRVLEAAGLDESGPLPIFTRSFEIGPRERDLVLQVAHLAGATDRLREAKTGELGDVVLFGSEDGGGVPATSALIFDGHTRVEVNRPDDFTMFRHDYSITARIKTRRGGTLFAKTEPGSEWVPDGKAWFVRDGRLVFDIGWVGAVTSRGRVDDDRWHDVAITYEQRSSRVRLYVDGRPDGEGRLESAQNRQGHVVRLGFGAADFPAPQTYFDGQMAQVRFYDGVLSADELTVPGQAHLVAWWPLDSVHAAQLADASGGGHVASIGREKTQPARTGLLAVGLSNRSRGFKWGATREGNLRLTIPRGPETLRFALRFCGASNEAELRTAAKTISRAETAPVLASLTHGGPTRWGGVLSTRAKLGRGDGAFAVDVLTQPESNPWLCQMRLTGLDFLPGGNKAVLCTWDGDVWEVAGIEDRSGVLSWRRIASGLFQPLGIKVVDGQVYVTCRDQIVILHDANGDGETDFYENFNSDHQVTEHFHEFAMGLQTDSAGNFYYTKAARHGLPALVPHHGTLLRVSRDGARTDILATGFRAPNGVCVNPDGTFFVTDQEGFWLPKNRINWVKPGSFHGNMWGYHGVTDPSDAAMEPPVCWITNSFDRSPGEIVRVEGNGWGALEGSLLNLSYGYGRIFIVLHEQVGDKMQGGMATLPIPQFPTGIMRGRFHPSDGQFYTCGMYAWAGNQTQPGGFYRVRHTGKPVVVPVGLAARRDGIAITFTGELDRFAATDPSGYSVRVWGLKRSANYGSEHVDERSLTVRSAKLSANGRTVELAIPNLTATWCMAITYAIKGAGGSEVAGEIHNTIHQLGARAAGEFDKNASSLAR
jgi:putative heme-binding domain-containing protein